MKVTNKNYGERVINGVIYLHGGQQESEVQIVWEPGVDFDIIIF